MDVIERDVNVVLTSFGRKLFEVKIEANVVLWLRLGPNHCSILALEDIIYAIVEKLVPATDAHGQQESSLAIGR